MKHKIHKMVKMIILIGFAALLIVFIVFCAGKIKLAQNEKNIIGTWKNSSLEDVITFQDGETILVNKDMPDVGLYCGDASYYFSYTDIICVTQESVSTEFEIDVDSNELIIYFMGQEYLALQK